MKSPVKNKEIEAIETLIETLGPAILKGIRDPFGIFSNYRILWLNKRMAALCSGEPDDSIGKICYSAFYGRKEPCNDCPMNLVIETGRTQVVERSMIFPDGKERWGEVRVYPVRGDDRNILAIIVMVIEITEKKQKIKDQRDYSEYLSKKLNETTGKNKKIKYSDEEITLKIKLSRRESDVLRLMTEGYTNVQISDLLHISINTVKSHVNHVFNKLGVNDRTQAAVLATRNKLI